MKQLLETAIDEIVKTERRIFLQGSTDNKGNGYYPGTLTAGSWKLDMMSPGIERDNSAPISSLNHTRAQRQAM